MWLPYFLYEFWESVSEPNTVSASQADRTEREFEICFFLENPPARRRGVELRLDAPLPKQQRDDSGREAAFLLQPGKNGDLEAVIFKIKDSDPKAAFRYCFDQLSKLLSFWAVTTGSGFSIFGLAITDPKHKAKWKMVPQRAASTPFFMPSEINLSDEYAALLSLYREARNSASPFYRLLCCYKILEAWYTKGSIFGYADRLVQEKNLSVRRPKRTVTQEMLTMSLLFNRHPEFLDVSFGKFFELLNPWRVKVAHAITDAGDFINLDQYQSQIDVGPIANLADMVAQRVLLDEVDLWSQIREAELSAQRTL